MRLLTVLKDFMIFCMLSHSALYDFVYFQVLSRTEVDIALL